MGHISLSDLFSLDDDNDLYISQPPRIEGPLDSSWLAEGRCSEYITRDQLAAHDVRPFTDEVIRSAE